MNIFIPPRVRGQILIITALSILVLVLVVGIAVDSGIGYGVKAKLNAAVDAAALAAGRAVAEGSTSSEQAANAVAAAEKFFAANYPSNYLGSTPAFDTPQITFDQGKVIIDISASAQVPTYFMRLLGFGTFDVSAGAQVIRKDLDMAFVLDVTDSLLPVVDEVKDSAELFINQFNESQDRMALVTFAYGAVVDEAIRQVSRGFDKASVINRIHNITFGGYTNFSEGFWNARDQLNGISPVNRSSLRVIVFFTDGSPNTFAATFNFRHDPSHAGAIRTCKNSCTPEGLWQYNRIATRAPYPWWKGTSITSSQNVRSLPTYYNPHDPSENEFLIVNPSHPRRPTNNSVGYDNLNRVARNLVEDMAAAARAEGIYVFTLGMEGSGHHMTGPSGPDNERGEDILMRMANDPRADTYNPDEPVGLFCLAMTEDDLKPCFARLASAILRISL